MNDSELRDRLLELEKITPELEARYRKQMNAIFERPLTPATRIGLVVGLLMGIGFFVLFSTVTVVVTWLEPGFPILGRIMFAGGAVFGLAFAVLNVVILRKGTISLGLWRNVTLKQFRTVHPAAFGITWTFCVLITVACLMMAGEMEDAVRGNKVILSGIVTMVLFGIPITILSVATESELLLREKFLQLELQLAELRELITSDRSGNSRDSATSE